MRFFNKNWFNAFTDIIKRPDLQKPHVTLKSFQCQNFEKLENLGIEYIHIDKDNTLTQHNKTDIVDVDTLTALNKLISLYHKNAAMLSNNSDPNQLNKLTFIKTINNVFIEETSVNIDFVKTLDNNKKISKPWADEAILKHWNLESVEQDLYGKICFIGDRKLTDVYQAKRQKGLAIQVNPIEEVESDFGIYLARLIENFIASIKQNNDSNDALSFQDQYGDKWKCSYLQSLLDVNFVKPKIDK